MATFMTYKVYNINIDLIIRYIDRGKNTLYGIDNTEISETVLKYQISDFP